MTSTYPTFKTMTLTRDIARCIDWNKVIAEARQAGTETTTITEAKDGSVTVTHTWAAADAGHDR
jgi:hypothetical protein